MSEDTTKAFLSNGVLKNVHVDTKPDYYLEHFSDGYSPTTNLIPLLSGVSGARVLIGDKASLQASSLVHREAPLVQPTPKDGEKSFHETYGQKLGCVMAKVGGVVTEISEDHITVGKEKHDMYNHFLSGRKSFLHNIPKVKVGDRVSVGDILATSNFTDKDGTMALGINLNTLISPHRSMNFEDAFIVTESGAKKLVAEQLIPTRVAIGGGVEANKSKYISLFANKYTNDQLSRIDSDGVIKKGSKVHHGDPLILVTEPRTLKSLDAHLGNLSKLLKKAHSDRSQTWHLNSDGEVVDVSKGKDLITVTVKTQRPMEIADKLSNSFGAKGVVTILPDSHAPTGPDGKPVDLILNTMSITSRIAPALPQSMAIGKAAIAHGSAIKVQGAYGESLLKKTKDIAEKHGIDTTEKLYDPVTGQHFDAFVGPLYVTRLHHNSEDKVSARGEGQGYTMDSAPSKGDHDTASKKVGNLSTNAMLAHNATSVLEDAQVIRGTNNPEYWRARKLGLPTPTLGPTFAFTKFLASLQGGGIKVSQKKNEFAIQPMTDSDIEELSHGKIENASTYKLKNDNMVFEAGGLFDETKTGLLGDRYNHIELAFPVPNPISEDYLRKLLKVTEEEYQELITTGSLHRKLEGINVPDKIKELETKIKSGRKSEKDHAVKVLYFLKNLQNLNLHPKDLMMKKVLTIPAKFRPIALQGERIFSAGVNELYRDAILLSQSIKDAEENDLPEDVIKQARAKQYDSVKAIYGLGDPINAKNVQKGFKGLLSTSLGIQGGTGKTSFFQYKVVNHDVDLVGRAVLVPEAKLHMDEASVPHDMAWGLYKPLIIGKLVQQGLPATQALEYVDKRHPIAKETMMGILPYHPAIISRDPQLHKWSSQGFILKLNPDKKDSSFKLNPLVYKGFGADNDGDQCNIQIPASNEARDEVLKKMMPSKNLVTSKTMGPMYLPANEAALGLYQTSTEKGAGHHNFDDIHDVLAAFNSGKIKIHDKITLKKYGI